jgi:hypothetical protein
MLHDLVGRAILDDLPIEKKADPVGDRLGKAHLVRDDPYRHALFCKLADEVVHVLRELRIEGACCLIEVHDLGVHAEGAGNGNALLLAPRKLARHGTFPAFEAEPFQKLFRFLPDLILIPVLHDERRIHYVLEDSAVREEVVVLEDKSEAHARLTHGCLVVDRLLRSFADHGVPVGDASCIEGLQEREAAKHRGLAGTGRADE